MDSFQLAWKNEPCSEGSVKIGPDSTEIFKFLSVLIIAQHSLDSFRLAQKNEPYSLGSVQIGRYSAEILKFLLKFNQNCPF